MKELRWTVRAKGDTIILNHFKRKWTAKLYCAFRKGKHSITYERIHTK